MLIRVGFLLALSSVLIACVSNTTSGPLHTSNGRHQALDAYIQLGIGYLQEGLTEQAKIPLQKALELDPKSADAHAALAAVFQRELEVQLAEQHYQKALALESRNSRILNNYGGFLYEQGDFSGAYQKFQAAAQDPMYVGRSGVFENLGLTALRLNDKKIALEYFQRSLRLNAQQPSTLLETALLLYERQDYVLAQKHYESFTRLSEHNARSLLLGVRLAKIFQDRTQATELGLQLKRLYPASAEYKQYQSEQ
ncbi:type IV pilus biogenesis/stability protein PilW [Denitrificimonas sp. JX-1]|uniref:Type IV pilus biogenesis/stability protein PilW n=1 Tax=Denitrificimonas halotolerans TaxID=3098930 RepID=A0ABU5GSH8_9GAMM|nr:type IV pilus biogenesis/stability protein PilW [Denitrificimonas sp. JX-1]MDY7219936.1 type IV pilus biogenesis/stability protein PilW [Denitrificimonas sp. JX-1]